MSRGVGRWGEYSEGGGGALGFEWRILLLKT